MLACTVVLGAIIVSGVSVDSVAAEPLHQQQLGDEDHTHVNNRPVRPMMQRSLSSSSRMMATIATTKPVDSIIEMVDSLPPPLSSSASSMSKRRGTKVDDVNEDTANDATATSIATASKSDVVRRRRTQSRDDVEVLNDFFGLDRSSYDLTPSVSFGTSVLVVLDAMR